MKKIIQSGIAIVPCVLLTFIITANVYAHCEIPCGIYDDEARIQSIKEDIRTVEKSMTKIHELSADPSKNMNQIVRWVNNKEVHADRIRDTVTHYYLAQRVKRPEPGQPEAEYLEALKLLHAMIVTAMKAKQTTNLDHVSELRRLADEFEAFYQGIKK